MWSLPPRLWRALEPRGGHVPRLRCLANAVSFAARVDATVVLSGSWELFAEATLDTECVALPPPRAGAAVACATPVPSRRWLTSHSVADVVLVHKDDQWPPRGGSLEATFENSTVEFGATRGGFHVTSTAMGCHKDPLNFGEYH